MRLRIETIHTSNKNFILDVGMEKEQKQEFNWGGYLYHSFLHSTTVSHYVLHVHSVQWNAGMDTLHPNSRIKFLLLESSHITCRSRSHCAGLAQCDRGAAVYLKATFNSEYL